MIYGYQRVSSTEQADASKGSLPEQERMIQGIAMVKGWGVDEMFVDAGVSGLTPLSKRGRGGDLMRILKKGDVVIAAKLDRMFRSTSDALETVDRLTKIGAEVILADIGTDPVNGQGVGRLFLSIMASVAEFDRWRVLERLNEGKRFKRAAGGHAGGVAPYGYKVVGKGKAAVLVPLLHEQEILAFVRGNTGLSLRAISGLLLEKGWTSRSGQPFTAEQVRRMMGRSHAA